MIGKSKAPVSSRRSARASSAAGASPNFGGFVAAPKFIAYDTADQDTSPLSVFATGDFNKDGRPDVVTVQVSGAVNAILNQGGGAFGKAITTVPGTLNVGGAVQALAIDVNKDGYDDLVLLDGVNNAVDVLIGNKDGSFGEPQTYSFSNYIASSIVSADLNGDGFPDLVVLGSNETFDENFNATTTVEMDTYLNDGQGNFVAPTAALKQILTYSGSYETLIGRSVILADVNGDGILDATVEILQLLDTDSPDEDHMILTFLGQGAGAFQPVNQANNIVIPAESTFNIGYRWSPT